MNILVLGGYGVFGGRLARLLLRDGHKVWIAGRNIEKATRFTAHYGGTPLFVDLDNDLGPIAKAQPDLVVDAAGPFQAYGDDPYRVASVCIAEGLHYLDFSDDAAFTMGITRLDSAAKKAAVVVLSGVSSVPALSSSVVAALREGLDDIKLIDMAILPGNRAPRGRSVMASILAQAGASMRLWRGGSWQTIRAWSRSKNIRLDKSMMRRASVIGVPDIELFPAFFKAESVIFRAGLELPLMHRGLEVLSWLRGCRLVPRLTLFLPLLHVFAKMLKPFGTDRGGMLVDVTGRKGEEGFEKHAWRLIVEAGEGPFIPAVPARAMINHIADIAPGARPALAELPLSVMLSAMDDLAVTTGRFAYQYKPLFQNVLGDAWHSLPETIQCTHSVIDQCIFTGRSKITRGKGLIARMAALLFGFPKAGEDIPVTVTMTCTETQEVWQRNFAGKIFHSTLTLYKGETVRERFGPFQFELALHVKEGSLYFPVHRGWFLGLPLPGFLLPKSTAREYEMDRRFYFDVRLDAPLGGGLMVHYQGWISPERS